MTVSELMSALRHMHTEAEVIIDLGMVENMDDKITIDYITPDDEEVIINAKNY